jgi:hypothetical protein
MYGMPTLTQHFREEEFKTILPEVFRSFLSQLRAESLFEKDILFCFIVQHDCKNEPCATTGKHMQLQERQESGVEIPVFEHTTGEHFIINTHVLHNTHLLCKVLPRDLMKPVPYVQN